ncbi:MAG: hypothetical protein HXY34_11690 [Candidatus Thorarchaeota archaeon]|nr:hypothetical protein [Candidatus Thorarchaeota archaeon]
MMELTDSTLDGVGTDTTKYLIGDMGVEILCLVDQGCTDDNDLVRLGGLSMSCLEVKIPLLTTLGLLIVGAEGYRLTPAGQAFLEGMLGWAS